jgi:hypothetical protein
VNVPRAILATQMKERRLIFPNDAVGWLDAYRGEERIVGLPARGEIRVPADTEVILSLKSPVVGLYNVERDAIHSVWLPKKTTTDQDLARVSHLACLRELHASKARLVTDGGVAHLARLRGLRTIDLSGRRHRRQPRTPCRFGPLGAPPRGHTRPGTGRSDPPASAPVVCFEDTNVDDGRVCPARARARKLVLFDRASEGIALRRPADLEVVMKDRPETREGAAERSCPSRRAPQAGCAKLDAGPRSSAREPPRRHRSPGAQRNAR